ncbi:MAG: replication protein C [Ferrovum sp.]|nr:replication protein C [Ferrovum sp.]
MSFDLTHARHDPACCLAPGLFRSLKRGERKKQKLDITYNHGMDTIRYWGPEPLGALEMRVMQGLVAMAAVSGDSGRGIMLCSGTESKTGQALRRSLDLRWESQAEDAMVVQCSFRQLAREVGADEGGSQIKFIRGCLERLYAVTIIVESDGKRHGFRMLSKYSSDVNTEKLCVALNPRLAQAIMGERPYTRISMDEVRQLRTDPASLIHQRLCGWIDPGKTGRATLDTLCGYVWPDDATPEAMKKRRQSARRALAEIAMLSGWVVSEYSSGKFAVKRPEIAMTAAQRSPKRGITFPAARHNVPQSSPQNAAAVQLF